MFEIGSIITIEEAIKFYGLKESKKKAQRIREYLVLLKKRRVWAGLSSRNMAREPEDAIVESLALASVTPKGKQGAVVDIGSGGGILGMTIAIARPELEITLVESLSRKAAFLAEVSGALALENARIVNARAEELARECGFDCAVTRAAGALRVMAPIAIGLLRVGGRYITLKSSDCEKELRQAGEVIERSGGKVVSVRRVAYPPGFEICAGASLVVIEKL